jgi:hypothetical protein
LVILVARTIRHRVTPARDSGTRRGLAGHEPEARRIEPEA